jgi:type IV pilus assembly protein PilV
VLTGNAKATAIFARHQRGATLIEILISVLLLSFGILAVVGMQAYSIAAQRNASNRAIASMLANEFAEIVRLNPTAFNGGAYDVALMPTAAMPDLAANNCVYPNCTTPALLASTDLNLFQRRVRFQLPQGGVELARVVGTPNQAHLWILWSEPGVLDNDQDDGTGTMVSRESTSENCSVTASSLAPLPRCFYAKVEL